MGIEDILESHDPYTIKVTPKQLLQFAKAIVEKNNEKLAAIIRNENADKLITVKDAQNMLGKCRKTLWSWDKSGYLVSVKCGNKNYYHLSDIERILKGKGDNSTY
ncbi:helix-turn-helix domain-containing protein [Prevotella cerevisiae]|jgi:transcriptional regulator CtsR|uniref:Helix-turn-helix domain-containing protein n=1 Tax=Segatella cerevisiae TaxID=2053716 RepID=A0ABT1BZY2_9BACT|nr:helix-turn-helix domain-containing protein [Segatella cerevisiae]MCO6026648.1 helix-turn-helix domain-containing protein [Segatella cerevisiae]MDD4760110.1 helix-turn-helix domain-containing protein [Bacteroidaceae bacterium]